MIFFLCKRRESFNPLIKLQLREKKLLKVQLDEHSTHG